MNTRWRICKSAAGWWLIMKYRQPIHLFPTFEDARTAFAAADPK